MFYSKRVEFEMAQWKAYENPRQYLSNPLNAFTMMRRLSIDWPIIKEITNRFNKGVHLIIQKKAH